MKLSPVHAAKVDPDLRAALERGKGEEPLRVIMTLGPAGSEESAGPEAPAGISSREEYRRYLIDRQREAVGRRVGETLRALREMALNVTGGDMSPVAVVEGTIAQIVRSLDLEGVEHASLDQPIELIRPRRRG